VDQKENPIFMKKIIYITSFAVCILNIDNSLSQVEQEWVQRYNGPENAVDGASSVVLDGSGNVYVTGWSYGNGTNSDYATIKYNSENVQQWVVRYNGPDNATDGATSIVLDVSGNVYVTGYSWASGSGYDYTTIKYSSSGVQQWIARYNGPGNNSDYAYSIALDGTGNVYVTGVTTGNGTDGDYTTIKYSSSGAELWIARYNGPGNNYDAASSLAVDGTGNVYVTGESWGSGTNNDYATVKYNSSGIQQWVSRYNGPGNNYDAANSIALDGTGNVYVTGDSYGEESDYATIKYNSAGVQQWVSRYNGPGDSSDYAALLSVDGSGNVFVTGESQGEGTDYDYATIKYNSSGVQQWASRYNGPGNDVDKATSLSVDGTGNVYVTGQSQGEGTGYDYATIKYNSSGVQHWIERYNGPAGNNMDCARSLALDASGNVYVTGDSWGSLTNRDYATIKYSQIMGIQPVTNQIPSAFGMEQNYPNPFNPITNVKFQIPNDAFVKLTVFDILGREAAVVVNGQLKAGIHEVEFDGSNLSSGVYFYQIKSGSFIDTKKMVLIK